MLSEKGLKERVIVKTPTDEMHGVLFVRADGLPEVRVTADAVEGDVHQVFRPATFPAVWTLRAPRNTWPGVLLTAWQEIEHIRERLRLAEQETEQDERDQAQQRETDARIAEEVDRQRGEAGA